MTRYSELLRVPTISGPVRLPGFAPVQYLDQLLPLGGSRQRTCTICTLFFRNSVRTNNSMLQYVPPVAQINNCRNTGILRPSLPVLYCRVSKFGIRPAVRWECRSVAVVDNVITRHANSSIGTQFRGTGIESSIYLLLSKGTVLNLRLFHARCLHDRRQHSHYKVYVNRNLSAIHETAMSVF